MSDLVITPEISLQLQKAVNTAGLTEGDLWQLLQPKVLEQLLPLLNQQGKIVLKHTIPVWREIEIGTDIVHGIDLIRVLDSNGVEDHFFSFDSIRPQLQIGTDLPAIYELFLTTPLELGIKKPLSYEKVVSRAKALGIHDGTVPLTIIADLVIHKFVTPEAEEFRYRIATEPVQAVWFGGEVGFTFSLANGFISEDPKDTSLSKEDVLLLSHPNDKDSDEVSPNEQIIFSRKKYGELNLTA